MHRVYLDNNSTTQTDIRVLEAMMPYFHQYYGNPSNLHAFGRETKEAMEIAREEVASLLSAKPAEIIFTSSGTEANNLAIKGVLRQVADKGNHIITSSIEHSSILNSLEFVKKWHLAEIAELGVDKNGLIEPEALKQTINRNTVLVSIMHTNNEIGTIEPIKELCKVTHGAGIYFHTDAVAAAGKIPLDVNELGVDLLTISAHKIHGPKGVGALYLKEGINIGSIMHGGMQEHGLRAGTENLPGIVGFGKAAVIAKKDLLDGTVQKIEALRNLLEIQIAERIPDVKINGHPSKRVCNLLNISIAYVEGESILMNLDLEGIAVSSGSACSVGKAEASHVLKAIGIEDKFINSPIRLSLDKNNTKEEIDYTIETLVKIVERLRAISPLWKPKKK